MRSPTVRSLALSALLAGAALPAAAQSPPTPVPFFGGLPPDWVSFWNGSRTTPNGTIQGGSGTWDATTMNWTNIDGTKAGTWGNGIVRVRLFGTVGGVVTVQGTQQFDELGFSADGYVLTGGSLSTRPMWVAGMPIDISPGVTVTIASPITGGMGLSVSGNGGTLVLTGANSFGTNPLPYVGETVIAGATLSVGADENLGAPGQRIHLEGGGALRTTASFASPRSIIIGQGNGTIETMTGTTLTLSGGIRENCCLFGGLIKRGNGTLTLAGYNGYSGDTNVNAGTLRVNGTLSSPRVNVAPGAVLTGSGNVGGNVSIAAGATLAPGDSVGTLTVDSLALAPTSYLDYQLATPGSTVGGINDLLVVDRDLTLDGSLNVINAGGFGIGTYRLVNYGGALVDNGLAFGQMPLGYEYSILSGGGQVNLIVSTEGSKQTLYWDGGGASANGVVNGGSRIWMANAANWTNAAGTQNTTWGGRKAVFQGASGTVMVQGLIAFTGMQFHTGGYALRGGVGGALTPTGRATIGVDTGLTTEISAPIVGNGGLEKIDGGTLVLTGANSYTGGTLVSGGTLVGNSQSLVGDIVDNASVVFDQGTNGTYAGVMSGSGTLTKTGAGTLVLSGANSYAGGTAVSAGALQGTTTSLQGAIANDAVTIFDQATDGTYAGAMSGAGVLMKNGSGAVTLTGANSYSGGTLVNAGTLSGNSTSLQGAIVNNASLVFDQSTNGAFRGSLFGTGTFTKTGAGTLFLSGGNPVQGPMLVNAGTVALDGTLGGRVDVARGATFAAKGAIGGTLTSDGTVTLTPGAAGPGTLTVVGDVNLHVGSQFNVGVDASGAYSRLMSGGTANIGGANIAFASSGGNYARGSSYPILQAAHGVKGTATVTSTQSALEPVLSNTTNALLLTLFNTAIPLQTAATSSSGSAVAAAFDRLRPHATGDLANVIHELAALSDGQLAASLDSAAGEIYVSSLQMAAIDGEAAMDLVRGQLADGDVRSGGDAALLLQGRANLGRSRARWWSQINGQVATFDADRAHAGDAWLRGFDIGVDRKLSERWLAGGGGGYSTGTFTLDGIAQRAEFNAPRAFGYLEYSPRRWAANLGTSVARSNYDTRRTLQFAALAPSEFGGGPLFGGVNREARGTSSGVDGELWGETRLLASLSTWNIQPSAGLRYARYGRAAWQETGADSLSLAGEDQGARSVQADAGVRFSRTVSRLRPFASAQYRRELTDGRTSTGLRLGDSERGSFSVAGLQLARDTVLGRGGLVLQADRVAFSLAYEARRANNQARQAIQFSLGY